MCARQLRDRVGRDPAPVPMITVGCVSPWIHAPGRTPPPGCMSPLSGVLLSTRKATMVVTVRVL